MNEIKHETTAAPSTPKKQGGFRIQTGVRAAGEKVKYLEVKLQDIIITSVSS
ncbi:MAG: hypothetical protein JNK04_06955 [Myxococcales bacterium]|nr:hypothetical protein [Myxococcales bacterium]